MDIKTASDLQIDQNIIFLRGDLDVSENDPASDPRIQAVMNTARLVIEKGAYKVIIAGYRGRPKGTPNEEYSTGFLTPHFSNRLGTEVSFVAYDQMEAFSRQELYDSSIKVHLLENLRFWEGEDANDPEFVKLLLGSMASVYVNESFATSHRNNASVVGLPAAIVRQGGGVAAGLRFREEVEKLTQLFDASASPRILILSGVKEDKLTHLGALKEKFDKVLIAGRLPFYLGDHEKDVDTLTLMSDPKIVVANLNQDKEDITLGSIEVFVREIENAGTVVVAGPMGKFEDAGQSLGTRKVLTAIAESTAYKYAAGGDSEDAIRSFGLTQKFDWISVGGGASLEFMAKGALPGIEALIS